MMRRGLAAIFIIFFAGFGFAQEEAQQAAAPEASQPQAVAQAAAQESTERQAAAGADWYQGKPIKNIVFDGLRHVSSSELSGVVEPYIGLRFSDDVYGELYGKLYTLEYFDIITPSVVPADSSGAEVTIRFRVTERPVVSRINFSGNSGLRRNELMEVITLKVNDVVNQLTIRVDELALANKYLEKGYPDIRVRSATQPNKDASITVTFYIEEGKKITIEAFRFEGNSTFSERTLRGQLSLKAKGPFNDGAFQEAKLISDRAALTQYYHDRGYIDAEVIDVVQEPTTDEKGNNRLIITFRLYEGRIYNFGGVGFEGNRIFTTEQLSDLVLSKKNRTVNARQVEADLQRVADLYYENGYIFNTINRTEQKNQETGTVSYIISIVERDRAHIENIIIRGNEKTKEQVILREIPLESGDIFSKAKVMDGLRDLYNLQFFSNIVPDTPPGSADGLMDLVINVEEQPTTNVQFGLTFSGSSDPKDIPISLMLQYNDRNFLGYGNMFGVEGNASDDTQSISVQYTQRWLFGLPLSGGFDLTFRHTKRQTYSDDMKDGVIFNGDETGIAYPDGFDSWEDYYGSGVYPADDYLMEYTQWSISLGFSTGYRWLTAAGNLGLNGGIRAGWINSTYDGALFRPFDPVLRQNNTEFVPALSFWTSVALDQRDIYYDPSKGYYFIERFGYYGILPMEREHYTKSDSKAEYFITLFNLPVAEKWSFKAVLGFHTGLSFILPQPGRPAPVVENDNKLVIDGMFIGRGWSNQRLNYGLALWENWAEIRIPLVPGMLAFDMFFDAAAVKDTPRNFFNDFSMDDMYFSYGFGPRISIPQFPFRFLFTKGFQVKDGKVVWKPGSIGGGDEPWRGMDFVLSISLSTY